MEGRKRPNDNTSPKKGGKKARQEVCVTCKKKADKDAVVCQWCSKWEHWECGGLTNNEYDVLSGSSDKIMFFCTQCYTKVPFALNVESKISQQDEEQQKFDKRLQAVESKITDLLQGLDTQLEKHHQSLSTTIDKKLNTAAPQIPSVDDNSQSSLAKKTLESVAHSILSE